MFPVRNSYCSYIVTKSCLMYKFYQTKHEKKIINGTIPGIYANKVAKTITKLSDPHTAGILKRWSEQGHMD